jgi:hypothetical protein
MSESSAAEDMKDMKKREADMKLREEQAEKREEEIKKILEQVNLKLKAPDGSAGTPEQFQQLIEAIQSPKRKRRLNVPITVVEPEITYHHVKFMESMNDNETDDVQVGYNGLILHIQRGEDVILPSTILNVFRQGVYPTYKFKKNKHRKTGKNRPHYMFEVLEKKATEKQYMDMKEEGTAIEEDVRRRQIEEEEESD